MNDNLRQVTMTAAICVLAIAGYQTLRGDPSTASARSVTPSATSQVLHVTGAATVHLRPDRATISFSVSGQGGSMAEAETAASRNMSKLIAAMTADGVARKDLQTHDQNASQDGSGGYVAYQSLDVTVRHVLGAGKLVAAGVATGAVRDSTGPVFSMSSQQRGEDDALAAAVKQARARAQAIAGAAGLRITGVVSIQQQEQPIYAYPEPYAAADAGAKVLSALRPPVRPGRQDVSASVTIVYSYASS